jgi:RNA polymerase sigma-70 factor, ECF subfamily
MNDAPQHPSLGWRVERSDEPGAPNRRTPGPRRSDVGVPPATVVRVNRDPSAPASSSRNGDGDADPGNATDAASPAQAYQLWRGRVWRFVGRLGVPSEALEDATQDVFTAVFRRWDDFEGRSTRRTWVLGFAPRVASAYRRRLRQREPNERPSNAGAALPESGSAEHDPFETTARREATRIVQIFLDGLPEKDRQLFVLVDLEDTSVVEAAAVLELRTRRAYKCLEKVRRSLEAVVMRHRAAEGRRIP